MASRTSLLAWEVSADQEEPWRRFLQELSGSRYEEYAESRRRLDISAEYMWLAPKRSGGGMALVFLEAEDPERALRELAASEAPFDSWYEKEMRRLFGCDFARLPRVAGGELLFAWRETSGEGEQRNLRGALDPAPHLVEGGTRKAKAESEAGREGYDVSAKYHPGEIEVQERAGVRSMAERVGNSIHLTVPPAAREFLEEQPLVVVGSVSADGRVWASLLVGKPGFVRALDERTVRIDATPSPGDPLAEALQGAGTEVGVLAIDLATRRRLRLNGEAERRPDGIYVRTRQVYANCPKYIQIREPEAGGAEPGSQDGHVLRTRGLKDEQRRLISDADTFFIASAHPEGGADASHRGGNPGFVRFLDEDTLEFPDYSGNTMFNTLGNIVANPSTGLLYVDFECGGTLQLTGEARIVWDAGRAARFAGAERVVEFRVLEAVETRGAVPLRWRFEGYSPFNPA